LHHDVSVFFVEYVEGLVAKTRRSGRLKPSLGRRESVKDNEWPVRGGGGTGADVRAATATQWDALLQASPQEDSSRLTTTTDLTVRVISSENEPDEPAILAGILDWVNAPSAVPTAAVPVVSGVHVFLHAGPRPV
jgi:hypothetical protein